jgi:hypothetical protein
MRAAFVAAFALILLTSIAPEAAHAADFSHLRGRAGEYTDVILADPVLDAELHRILGADYADFMSVMDVVLPTTLVDKRFLVAEGCRAHDCGNNAGLVVIDLDTGDVTAFRRGQYGYVAGSPALQAFIAGWRSQAE